MSRVVTATSVMAAACSAEFAARGVCCLSNLLSADELAHLRTECDMLRRTTTTDALLDADCVVGIPPADGLDEADSARCDAAAYLAARGSRSLDGDAAIARIVLSALPAVASAALDRESCSQAAQRPSVGQGPCLLFNEHYVCKPAAVAGAFCWHTDAAHQLEALYALGNHACAAEYVSVWVPLDDISADNGALMLLPLDAPQPPDAKSTEPASDETEAWLQGAAARGHALTTRGMRAGDALLFASTVWHCSEPNVSEDERRVYYAQFSRGVVGTAGKALALAVPTTPDNDRLLRARLTPLVAAAAAEVPVGEAESEEREAPNPEHEPEAEPPRKRAR